VTQAPAKPMTATERAVAAWLDEIGVEYVVKPKLAVIVGGRRRRLSPDFVVPDERLVIEANGCFVHGCPECYGDRGLVHNRDRDDVRLAAFERAGYEVEVVWEHEVSGLTSAAARGRALSHASPARPRLLRRRRSQCAV